MQTLLGFSAFLVMSTAPARAMGQLSSELVIQMFYSTHTTRRESRMGSSPSPSQTRNGTESTEQPVVRRIAQPGDAILSGRVAIVMNQAGGQVPGLRSVGESSPPSVMRGPLFSRPGVKLVLQPRQRWPEGGLFLVLIWGRSGDHTTSPPLLSEQRRCFEHAGRY
ncbi:uncharacterized protein K460DRAFT_139913 [Cucurbitaria berberidis CBS 394.84]|uniref:Uncharacterized protein n=1 Tax=Cucurbitaria berberidis CBS 394.84 TaxID=1168544 RepID=A0A9P4GDC1_9PLEO|nr:uncharacterized protein K460DRAFT_139913 [Cucurbitaria berberidis CBS 394.84]KAF1843130.1 hypothetical protein K460DRAFT_139913 [Cucurbitaria berberidis CBS 394.84]